MAPVPPFSVPAFADPSVYTVHRHVGGRQLAQGLIHGTSIVLGRGGLEDGSDQSRVDVDIGWCWLPGAVLAVMSSGSLGRTLRPAAALVSRPILAHLYRALDGRGVDSFVVAAAAPGRWGCPWCVSPPPSPLKVVFWC